LSHPLGELAVTYALHLKLVGKPVYDFLFVIIELFLLALILRCYRQKSVDVSNF